MEHTVTEAEAGRTVRDVLTGELGVSGRMVQRLTRSQGVRLNRRPAYLARAVRAGDVVAVRLAGRERGGPEPVEMPLAVVWEDDDVLVVDKPPFVLVHPTSAEHTETLAHGVAHRLRARGLPGSVHPVHRIDRDTSGLVVFALHAHAHARLDAQLRGGGLERRYLALVRGEVEGEAGVVEAPIGRHPRHRQLRTVREDGEPALTRWRVLERLRGATLLEVELETGRTHQVRVHLAHAGHPVLGDRQYGGGGGGGEGLRRQALHAWRLEFHQPTTGERLRLEAPMPPDLEAVRAALADAAGARERAG